MAGCVGRWVLGIRLSGGRPDAAGCKLNVPESLHTPPAASPASLHPYRRVWTCRPCLPSHQADCSCPIFFLSSLQACVDLPAMDCEPAALAGCYKGAATCADYFWSLCFDRWVLYAYGGLVVRGEGAGGRWW